MNQIDVPKIAKELTWFCQQQVTNVMLSPVKQTILLAVIASIVGPQMPEAPKRWLFPDGSPGE